MCIPDLAEEHVENRAKALVKRCLSCGPLFWLLLLCCPAIGAQQLLAPANSPLPASPQDPALAVIYENGLLTIRANNTTLSAILQQVRAKTGATIENTASGEGQARVVADFGPGEPAEVMAQLLYGTSWNYAVLGSLNDPGKITRILLMPKRAPAPEVARTIIPPAVVAPPQPSATLTETDEAKDNPEAKNKKAATDKKDKDSDEQAKDDSGQDKTKSAKKTDDKQAETGRDATQDAASNPDQNSTPVFPSGLYRLYPSLFGNQESQVSTGAQPPVTVTPSGNSGSASSLYSAMGGRSSTGGVQADYSAQAPVTPQQFPPELWKLYPPNILDIIKTAAPPPPIPTPVYVPPGSGVMWDQGITAAAPGR